jgi:hypothetical protein
MCDSDSRNMVNPLCNLFGRLTTSTSEQGLFRENNPTNNSIPSLLWLDSKPREITPGTYSTIPISGMGLELSNN